jgi:hypothetical protein
MIRTPSKKVALLSTRQAFQYDMPVRERFDPTGYVQGTFDIEELEETKEASKTLTGTLSTILNMGFNPACPEKL